MEGLVLLVLVIIPAILLLVLIRVLVFYPAAAITVSTGRAIRGATGERRHGLLG